MPGRRVRTVAVFLALAVAAGAPGFVLAGCDKTPTVDDYLKRSRISGKQRIRIGINGNQPLMGYEDPRTHALSGFDVEIARSVARLLGFTAEEDITWVKVQVEDRERMLEGNQLDMVVASYSITDDRRKLVSFAGPYLITSQEVLVPLARAGRLNSIAELQRARVCTSGGSTSEKNLRAKGVTPLVELNTQDCVAGLRSGDYDAVSSDVTILAGISSQYPGRFEIVDIPIGEGERLGVGVAKADPYLRDVITQFLMDSADAGEDGFWRIAFDKTIGPHLPSFAAVETQPEPEVYQRLRDHDDGS